ncbi:hypothetical protein Q5424_08995 [Conexibacter sp. JD483]|uniref:hypothetical protein n=1 Tax=unclassified Conexibacter TaxID=2627773 RepID=UPI00271EFDB1|nr:MULTISPECIES: hypothetical protein [unclassified Conexibacter]MDO8184503.1 hypothetical protein [Conexibacter sp. CPCC 205706]MDO8197809.1 hypothetical protein [Conexibacter sp. CPCC 205762]MDR9369215.1 hypothetical protein [Conexibacter sp. JD483]
MSENCGHASHQTIRLSKGKHAAPTEGACVMELASMLAGEPFSDRPATACPVIGGFLRAYNDRIDDQRRQDLYRYAAEVVATRGSADVERARERRCLEWAEERKRERARPLRWVTRTAPAVVDRRLGLDAAGTYAARSIRRHTDRSHVAALALIDELIAMGPQTGGTGAEDSSAKGASVAGQKATSAG